MAVKQASHTQLRYWRKRSRRNFITATISMSLVLYFLGIFMGVVLFGRELADRMRSKLELQVFLNDGIGELQQQDFEVLLRHHPAVVSLRFVSKEDAAAIMQERMGTEVINLNGMNPMRASYNLLLKPVYLNTDSLKAIETELEAERPVSEVVYQGDRLNRLDQNLKALSFIALGLGVVLTVVAYFLIFTTIRLNIYARRMVIRSMELVGATRGFILRPFLWQGIGQGILAGILAGGLLTATFASGQKWLLNVGLPVVTLTQVAQIGLLSGIVLFGLLLGLTGSYFAVNRYLNRSLDELA